MFIIWLLCLPFMLVSYALSGIAIFFTLLGFKLFPWLIPSHSQQSSPEELAESERRRWHSLSEAEKGAELDEACWKARENTRANAWSLSEAEKRDKTKLDIAVANAIQRESNIWKAIGFVLFILTVLGMLFN